MNSLCSPCSLRLAVALCALGLVTADVDLSECEMSEDEIPTPLWVEDGGFLVLIIGVIAMFWALAVGMLELITLLIMLFSDFALFSLSLFLS